MRSSIAFCGKPPKCMQKFSIWLQYCASSNNSDKIVSYPKFASYDCTVLTKMRVWNRRLKSEFRGRILRQPEKGLNRTVDQVVAAIILVDFKKKLHISVEYKSLIFCLSLHFRCPCTDFVSSLRIIHVCFRDDGESRVSIKIFFALWLDEGRPLWWHIYWAKTDKFDPKFHFLII